MPTSFGESPLRVFPPAVLSFLYKMLVGVTEFFIVLGGSREALVGSDIVRCNGFPSSKRETALRSLESVIAGGSFFGSLAWLVLVCG